MKSVSVWFFVAAALSMLINLESIGRRYLRQNPVFSTGDIVLYKTSSFGSYRDAPAIVQEWDPQTRRASLTVFPIRGDQLGTSPRVLHNVPYSLLPAEGSFRQSE